MGEPAQDANKSGRAQRHRSTAETTGPYLFPLQKPSAAPIKWLEKRNWTEKAAIKWANEPVGIDTVGIAGVRALVKNQGTKLRLINVWATWCAPCVEEFPGLVSLNRMYRDRGFELRQYRSTRRQLGKKQSTEIPRETTIVLPQLYLHRR